MSLASTRFASRTRTAPPPLASLAVYREDGGSNETACAISPLSSGPPTSPTRRTQRPRAVVWNSGNRCERRGSNGSEARHRYQLSLSVRDCCPRVRPEEHCHPRRARCRHREMLCLGQKNDCFVRCAVPRDGGEPVHRACRARVAHAAYRTGLWYGAQTHRPRHAPHQERIGRVAVKRRKRALHPWLCTSSAEESASISPRLSAANTTPLCQRGSSWGSKEMDTRRMLSAGGRSHAMSVR